MLVPLKIDNLTVCAKKSLPNAKSIFITLLNTTWLTLIVNHLSVENQTFQNYLIKDFFDKLVCASLTLHTYFNT